MTTSGLDLRGLSRNISATFLRQIAAALLGLVSTAIVARVYGPEGNGMLAIALLLPSMLSTFLNLGVAPANVYFLGSAQISVRQLLGANLRIFALLGALGLVLGAVTLRWQAEQLFPGVSPFVLWLALASFPIDLLNSSLISVFQGLQQFRPYNILAMTQSVAFLLLVIALTLAGNLEIALLVGAQVFSQFLVLVVTIRWLLPLVGPREDLKPPWDFVKRTLSYGWKAHLGNILTFINYKADIFLTNLFLGPAAVGVYVIAVALAEKLWLVSQAVSTVLLPRLSQLSSDEGKRKELTPLVARWVLLTTLLGAFAVGVLAEFLLTLVFGPEYKDALVPLWILLPGIVLISASRVMANDIAARGRPELNMYTAIAVASINVIGNLILIPSYGLPGAAAATTIAYTLDLILRLIIYRRFTKNKWTDSLFVKISDFHLLKAYIARP